MKSKRIKSLVLSLTTITLLAACQGIIEPISSGPNDEQMLDQALDSALFNFYRINEKHDKDATYGTHETDAFITKKGDIRLDIYHNPLIGLSDVEYLERFYYAYEDTGFDYYYYSNQKNNGTFGLGYSFQQQITTGHELSDLPITESTLSHFGVYNISTLDEAMFVYDENASGYYNLLPDYFDSVSERFFYSIDTVNRTLTSFRIRVVDNTIRSLAFSFSDNETEEIDARTLYYYFNEAPISAPETSLINNVSFFILQNENLPNEEINPASDLTTDYYCSFSLLKDNAYFLASDAKYIVEKTQLFIADGETPILLNENENETGITERIFKLSSFPISGSRYTLKITVVEKDSLVANDFFYSFIY